MLPSVVLYASRKSAWVGILYVDGLESNSARCPFTLIPVSSCFPRHAWNTKLIDIWFYKEVDLYIWYHENTVMFEIHTVLSFVYFKYCCYFGHCPSSWVFLPTFWRVDLFLSLLVSWAHHKHLLQSSGLSLCSSSSWVRIFLFYTWWQKHPFFKRMCLEKIPVIVQCPE